MMKIIIHMNESNEQGLNLSRSQQRGCSATYNTPFMIQVVCKGFTLPKVCLGRVCSWAKPIFSLVTSGKISGGLAGMDSDLEAFSHNPTGVASGHCLFRQPHEPIIRINGSSRTKLNYYCDNTHQ